MLIRITLTIILFFPEYQSFSQEFGFDHWDYHLFAQNRIKELIVKQTIFNKKDYMTDTSTIMVIRCDTIHKRLFGSYFHQGFFRHDATGIRHFYKQYDDKYRLIELKEIINDGYYRFNKDSDYSYSRNIIKRFSYNPSDSLLNYEYFDYNKTALHSVSGSKIDSTIMFYYSYGYLYNDKNRIIKSFYKVADKDSIIDKEWMYDEHNHLIRIIDYRQESIPLKKDFTYDSDNKLKREIVYMLSGNTLPVLYDSICYVYHGNKLFKKTEIIFESGTNKPDTVISYYDDNSNLIKEEFHGRNESYENVYEYQNNVLVNRTYSHNDTYKFINEYDYNSNGLILSELKYYSDNSKPKELLEYHYEYFND